MSFDNMIQCVIQALVNNLLQFFGGLNSTTRPTMAIKKSNVEVVDGFGGLHAAQVGFGPKLALKYASLVFIIARFAGVDHLCVPNGL